MSPKKRIIAKDFPLGQNKRLIDLSIILVYLRSHFDKWPSDKLEIAQYLEKFPRNKHRWEVIERLWQSISEVTTDIEVQEISSRSTYLWHVNMRSLLGRIAWIDGLSEGFSQDFLGEFVKDFAFAKFDGDVKSVYDPAFGFGNMLFAAFDGSRPKKEIAIDDEGKEFESNAIISRRLQGSEINSDVCKLVNTLGELCGYNINVSNNNSLFLQDPQASKHQLVVCEPPAQQKMAPEQMKQDWSFGLPRTGRADWAWAQIVNSHIAPEGYGLLFLLRGALFRPNESLIRAKMINSGAIRAVINLPSGSHSSTRLPMSLIVFAGENIPRAKEDQILFLSLPEPQGRPGTWEFVSSLHRSIHDACEFFYRFEKGKFERVIGYSAAVNRSDQALVNNSWNIDPSNYVTQVATGIDVELNVRKDMNLIAKSGGDLSNLIFATKEKFATFAVKAEFTTIGEMIETGKLIQVTGMSKNSFNKNESLGINQEDYLTVQDLRRNTPLEATGKVPWDVDAWDREEIRTEVNDVVFIKTGTPAARVDYHGGALLFSPLSVLRITDKGEKVVTPKILAFILNGEGIKKFMHGDSVGRLAIEKVPIPLLDSINRNEINEHLLAVETLIMKTDQLREKLNNLDQILSKVLWGQFDGLREAE